MESDECIAAAAIAASLPMRHEGLDELYTEVIFRGHAGDLPTIPILVEKL